MRKRSNHDPLSDEPPLKKNSTVPSTPLDVGSGTVLTDILGKRWRLGKSIGKGGFGMIYLVSNNVSQDVNKDEAQYVAKVEAHKSGPLFVERNCYLLIAKPEMINAWKTKKGLKHLGMPHYVASGSHVTAENKYRFLIIPRFNKDLDEMFEAKKCKFNLKTVLTIALQTIDVLEYIHSRGYVHSDIKASNILLEMKKNKPKQVFQNVVRNKAFRYYGSTPVRSCKVRKLTLCRMLRPNVNLRYWRDDDDDDDDSDALIAEEEKSNMSTDDIDKIYLLDYGLASKYLTMQGEHKEFCKDRRKAHAGTMLFCSRDAHDGAQSRRSDLECLGYNLIYWLTSTLPWRGDTEDPELVQKKKMRCVEHLKEFLDYSFDSQCPRFLFDYFEYLKSLEFKQEPDYKYCKSLFKRALKEYGYKDNLLLDFENLEGWGRKQKKYKRNVENFKVPRTPLILKRSPLKSNLPVKFSQPRRLILRKKTAKKLQRNMKWSRILDPEDIIRQANAREREMTDSGDFVNLVPTLMSIQDLNQLNPTTAMREIFYKSKQSNGNGISPRHRSEGSYINIEGYTPAMMEVYNRKKEREEMELEQIYYSAAKQLRNTRSSNNNNNNNSYNNTSKRSNKKNNNINKNGKDKNMKQAIIDSPPCTRLKRKLKCFSFNKKEKKEPREVPRRVYSLRG